MNPPNDSMDPTALANAQCATSLVTALTQHVPASQPLHVVVSPGARSTPLVLAFVRDERCRMHVVVDERAAAFFALGLAQKTGVAAVTVCTSGSAAAHGVPAAMEAHHAGIPLVVMTADRPHEAHDIGAPQTTAQRELYRACARSCISLPEPVALADDGPASNGRRVHRAWAAAGANAWAQCHGAWPGPVHINAPFREPLGAQSVGEASAQAPRVYMPPVQTVAAAAVDCLVEAVRRAKRGVVVCGPMLPATGDGQGMAAAVAAFAAASGWPVLAEAAANVAGPAVVDLGAFESVLAHRATADALMPDAVLQLGLTPSSRSLQQWLGRCKAPRIACTPVGVVVDAAALASVWVHGDAANLLEQASRRLASSAPCVAATAEATQDRSTGREKGDPEHDVDSAPQAAYLAAWAAANAEAAVALQAACEGSWFSGRAVALVLRHVATGSSLVVGNSLCIRDTTTFRCAAQPRAAHPTVIARRGVSGIDGAIAHAVGVAVARTRDARSPPNPVSCLIGDLTFWYDVSSLRMAAEYRADLDVIVVDNGGGKIFGELPIAKNAGVFEPYFVASPKQADPRAAAMAFGATFVEVDQVEQLREALSGRPSASRRGLRVIWIRTPADDSLRRAQAMAQVASAMAACAGPMPYVSPREKGQRTSRR